MKIYENSSLNNPHPLPVLEFAPRLSFLGCNSSKESRSGLKINSITKEGEE